MTEEEIRADEREKIAVYLMSKRERKIEDAYYCRINTTIRLYAQSEALMAAAQDIRDGVHNATVETNRE